MLVHAVILPVKAQHSPRTTQHVAQQRATVQRALIESARLSGAPVDGYVATSDGVPLVNDGWHWSVAHKRRCAVAAVARQSIGVDVEEIRPRDPAALAEIATDAELALISERNDFTFFRLWTAKEAVIKALGMGMSAFDNCRLTGTEVTHWCLHCGDAEWMVKHHFCAGHLFAAAGQALDINWLVTDGVAEEQL